jgi:hypothetical protein
MKHKNLFVTNTIIKRKTVFELQDIIFLRWVHIALKYYAQLLLVDMN